MQFEDNTAKTSAEAELAQLLPRAGGSIECNNTLIIQKMKQTKMAYVSPSVEAMSCKVEQGFQCSGEYCDGAMLENITESSHNPDASFN